MSICIIPARGGSQRIPRKNIKLFHGKPIIAYSIELAKESGLFEKIVVSTDDADIAAVAQKYGASVFFRSEHTSKDEVGTQEVAREVLLDYPGFEYACVIYPCAPLLNDEQLTRGYSLIAGGWWHYSYSVTEDGLDAGCYYWGYVKGFIDREPLDDGHTAKIRHPNLIDINTMEDWHKAENMYEAMYAVG